MNYNLDIDINLLKKQKEVLVNEAYTLLRSTYPKQQEEGQIYQGIISVLDSIQDQYEQTTSEVLKEYTVSATDTTHYQVTIKASSQEEAQEIAENMHQGDFDVDHNDGGNWDICSVLEVEQPKSKTEYVLFGSNDAIETFLTSGADALYKYIDWTTKAYPEGHSVYNVISECGMWDKFSFISKDEYDEIN